MAIRDTAFSGVESARSVLDASRDYTMRVAASPSAMALQGRAAQAGSTARPGNGSYDDAGDWQTFFAFGGPFGLPLEH